MEMYRFQAKYSFMSAGNATTKRLKGMSMPNTFDNILSLTNRCKIIGHWSEILHKVVIDIFCFVEKRYKSSRAIDRLTAVNQEQFVRFIEAEIEVFIKQDEDDSCFIIVRICFMGRNTRIKETFVVVEKQAERSLQRRFTCLRKNYRISTRNSSIK